MASDFTFIFASYGRAYSSLNTAVVQTVSLRLFLHKLTVQCSTASVKSSCLFSQVLHVLKEVYHGNR